MDSEKHSNANVLEIERSCLWRRNVWADDGQSLPDQGSRFWDPGIHSGEMIENIPCYLTTNYVAQRKLWQICGSRMDKVTYIALGSCRSKKV